MRSSSQLYVFGKGQGETTIYATSKSGRVVYAANVRVGNNISSVGEMLHLAMPDAIIQATPMNNLVLLTGTVANPDDVAEAQRLTQAYVGDGTQVVTRLRTATPLQVNLKVRIAEINRTLLKSMGVNLLSRDTTGGFLFGIGRGNPGTISGNTATFNISSTGTTLGAAGLGRRGRESGVDRSTAIALARHRHPALSEHDIFSLAGHAHRVLEFARQHP